MKPMWTHGLVVVLCTACAAPRNPEPSPTLTPVKAERKCDWLHDELRAPSTQPDEELLAFMKQCYAKADPSSKRYRYVRYVMFQGRNATSKKFYDYVWAERKRARRRASINRTRQIDALPISATRKKWLKDRRIWIGATAKMARLSWGRPVRINRTTNRYGTYEQWVYGGGNYLYLRNGRVSTIQN